MFYFGLVVILCKVKGLIGGAPCLPLQARRHDVVHHVYARRQNLVVIHEEPPHAGNDLLCDVLGHLLQIRRYSFRLRGPRGKIGVPVRLPRSRAEAYYPRGLQRRFRRVSNQKQLDNNEEELAKENNWVYL